jgi:general L-amino acid transport system substrate-binding protein
MIKRLAVLLAVLAMVAAACGGSSESDDTTSTTAAPTDDTTATTQGSDDDGDGDGGGDAGQGSEGGTLAAVQSRGVLKCGVSGALPGFSETQPDGTSIGFDADYCRAIAAAVLGDANAVEFRNLTAAERFDVLKAGEIDVLVRNTTYTQSRDASGEGGVNVDFAPTTYYDGQQLMGLSSRFSADSGPADVDGAILCTNAGTTTEKNITEWANLGGASIGLETVEQFPEALDKFIAGQCDLVTTDGSGLVANKVTKEREGAIAEGEWVVFPTAPISKEPLGPAFRQNDSEWGDIITWVVYATIIADEKGVTSENIDAQKDVDPEATRLFGGEGEVQTAMGLNADAFYQMIKQVGNYDEIFARNLNPLDIFREGTLNAPFNEGGMIYAPPAR